jgi:carbohydrate kinase (thermoresistant glucokinase family)
VPGQPSNPSPSETRVIVVMGVAGAGKTTVGRELAEAIAWEFHDADDFHSAANVAKMHRGEGLNDADRQPWLEALSRLIAAIVREGRHAVLACSALKQAYRDILIPEGIPASAVRFAYLDVPPQELEKRLENRHHYAGPSLLSSQLATLEKPKDAIWIDGTRPIAAEVRAIRDAIGL